MKNIIVDVYNKVSSKETRYAIFDADTGSVIDNAQGYGYKSKEKAYAAYKYKNSDAYKEQINKKKINKWLSDHPKHADDLAYIANQLEERRSQGEVIDFNVEDLIEVLNCSTIPYDFDVNYPPPKGGGLQVSTNKT